MARGPGPGYHPRASPRALTHSPSDDKHPDSRAADSPGPAANTCAFKKEFTMKRVLHSVRDFAQKEWPPSGAVRLA
jgi:hypothetical protein